MEVVIPLPRTWLDTERLEDALQKAQHQPHGNESSLVTFVFPAGCKIFVDAAIRLLSLANQLSLATRRVRLDFSEGESGVMGYLNRIGFFDHLAPEIEVVPGRPSISTAEKYRGANTGLVEIARINKSHQDDDLPTRLTNALVRAHGSRDGSQELEDAAWTIFAELIQNIYGHSGTLLDGYAVLQVYANGNRITVAVSDSGKGIMDTLRPALSKQNPKLAGLSDTNLLVEIFRQGLSRHGNDRGCGLKGCAQKAIRYSADLDIRLPNQRVLLIPSQGGYKPNIAKCYSRLPLIWGTHISFGFRTLNNNLK